MYIWKLQSFCLALLTSPYNPNSAPASVPSTCPCWPSIPLHWRIWSLASSSPCGFLRTFPAGLWDGDLSLSSHHNDCFLLCCILHWLIFINHAWDRNVILVFNLLCLSHQNICTPMVSVVTHTYTQTHQPKVHPSHKQLAGQHLTATLWSSSQGLDSLNYLFHRSGPSNSVTPFPQSFCESFPIKEKVTQM